MKLMMQSCINLIPEKVDIEELAEIYDYLNIRKIQQEWERLITNPDSQELRAEFGEAIAENIVFGLTILKAMEKMDAMPKNFTPAIFAEVFYDHYSKGYHSADFETEYEE